MSKSLKSPEKVFQDHSLQQHRFSRYLVGLGFIIFLLFILVLGGFILLWLMTPDVAWLQSTNPQKTAMMLYREKKQQHMGQPIKEIRKWVPLSEISIHLIRSVVMSEDGYFFQHTGFMWESIWSAMKINVRNKRIVGGGSTITQQLAKNLFLEPSPSLIRKIREAMITYKLEKHLTKVRILEIYLNIVEWGREIYGTEAAARTYFNKTAAELSLSESIRLAAVLPNPNLFSPLDNKNGYTKKRWELIAQGMLIRGWIDHAAYIQLFQELLTDQSPSESTAPGFVPPPEVSSNFLDPNYWITKSSEPDRLIMTDVEIENFNEQSLIVSGGIDIFGFPDFLPRNVVMDKILEVAGFPTSFLLKYGSNDALPLGKLNLETMSDGIQIRYDRGNSALTERFYYDVLDKMNLSALPDKVQVSYALVIRRTDVLAWPINELIMSKPYDYEFNSLEQSAVYSGTPAAVFHTSKDGFWAFIRTTYFDGWVEKKDLAFITRREAVDYPSANFLVVTNRSVRTVSGVELPMGTRIPIVRVLPQGYEIKIPIRGSNGNLVLSDDFLTFDGVTAGFLPYTKRNIINQAFKLSDAPYSWGGNKSGWDCSLFIQDVFSVFGIRLPRNSSAQIKVSRETAIFKENTPAKDKLGTIRLWEPAITLLGLPGHIMLYLGEDGGKPYAIHSIWGVRDKNGDIIKVNKITVTDLDLGQGGEKGSLLERITDVSGVYLDSLDLWGLLKDFFRWLFSHPHRAVLGFAFIILVCLGLIFFIFVMDWLEERRNIREKQE